MNPRRLILLAALTAGACGAEADAPGPTASDPTVVDVDTQPWSRHGAPAGLDVPAASPRRLSVDQLERSVEVILDLPQGSFVLPPSLSFPMGRPDFRTTTEAHHEPSPLFMKLMVDVGAYICGVILERDAARPAMMRILTPTDDVDTNLRRLWQRFTAISGADADGDVARLRAAWDDATGATEVEAAGYLAACVATMTSPEFLLY